MRGLFLRRKQYHLLFEERIPAGNKARLPGEPEHGHQDEEKPSHHFRVAIKENRKTCSRNWDVSVRFVTCFGMLLVSELQYWRHKTQLLLHPSEQLAVKREEGQDDARKC